ncbi:hypothetical protein LNV09_07460 [Paucibacter sp. B2R-40]|uniref:hypothetical protein n=1 Tax=Paucibacter sp. B2R-40 TaxID=2893554 RepID=UPI0021E49EE6|nr:hypothetical protein [Paucibacter sp. B2R-40]MCV2354002.1 hypothetical protein [Paucibacter sp. B2R-40]
MKVLARFIIIIATLLFGCFIFLAATITGGQESVDCTGVRAISEHCDLTTKYPRINPWLERLALPLPATLATLFGAAIGLAKARARLKSRFPSMLRWGGPIGSPAG